MIEWPDKSNLEYFAAAATIIGFPFAIAAVVYGARQLRLSRRSGSGAALIATSESFRQCWRSFLFEPDVKRQQYAFAELVNAVENACAIYNDHIFYGASRKILRASLMHTLSLFESKEDAIAE